MTVIKILFRLIVFPFVAAVILLAAIRNYFYTCWLWISKGGELLTYDETFNPETIRQQFERVNADKFCGCKKEIKTGCTSAMHCNLCGKLEQTEIWLK